MSFVPTRSKNFFDAEASNVEKIVHELSDNDEELRHRLVIVYRSGKKEYGEPVSYKKIAGCGPYRVASAFFLGELPVDIPVEINALKAEE